MKLSTADASMILQEIKQIIAQKPSRKNSEEFEDAKDEETKRIA